MRQAPNVATLSPAAVQRFYNRNRKRSFKQITGHKPPALQVPISDLGDCFRESMGTHQHHSAQAILERTEVPDNITGAPVEPEEVVARLTKASNSAPSPLDRLTYHHLRRFDPSGKALAVLFSTCLRTGITPNAWREYVTVLLYKRPKEPTTAEALNPKNWRPIALLPTVSKIFTGILAAHCVRRSRLTPSRLRRRDVTLEKDVSSTSTSSPPFVSWLRGRSLYTSRSWI